MSKNNKNPPKCHTKATLLYVVETDESILVVPGSSRGFVHFKRWAYRNIPESGLEWDSTAKLYKIKKDRVTQTFGGNDVLDDLKEKFDVKDWFPWE